MNIQPLPQHFDHPTANWQMLQLLSEQLLATQARIEALQMGLIALSNQVAELAHESVEPVAAMELEKRYQESLAMLRIERKPHLDKILSDNVGTSLAQ
jgi:hypothetical protein